MEQVCKLQNSVLSCIALFTLHCDNVPWYAEEKEESDVAGIPDFWLHVLQSHKGWSEEVSLCNSKS